MEMYVKIHRVWSQLIRRVCLQDFASVIKFVIMALCIINPALTQAFQEGWESSAIGTYSPDDIFLPANEGNWFIGDTVSEFPECGPTPQKVEIIQSGGSQALRLTSNDSNSGCSDNVWLDLFDASRLGASTINKGFAVSLTAETRITFKQSGVLFDAQKRGWGSSCFVPPCFDNISLQLEDNRGNILAYVLQRAPDAEANQPNIHFKDRYREIFLNPNAGTHNRNLFEDFSTIPDFFSSNAQIQWINLTVDEHGWAIFDDINIGTYVTAPNPIPEPPLEVPAEPTVMANGSTEPVAISTSENLSVTVALSANDYINRNADWWVLKSTPFGWFYYLYETATWINIGNSISNILPTYQGKVMNLPPFEILNIVSLPSGFYTFYFGIDMDMNGQLDIDSLLYDEIMVNVSDTDANFTALNDTGIIYCSNEDTNGLLCPISGYPRQDAQDGRDVIHNDDSDGHAGFSFTKLDDNGNTLPASATEWSCVKDNVTGLIWEVKTNDSGLHDKHWTYTWYNSNASTNGGSEGTANGGSCDNWQHCDTEKFVQQVNVAGLCGTSDWRMPLKKELISLRALDRYSPAIDSNFFPNHYNYYYWSGSPYASNSDVAWRVYFPFGRSGFGEKSTKFYVRLVRGG